MHHHWKRLGWMLRAAMSASLLLVSMARAQEPESKKVSEAPKDVTEKMTSAADTVQGWSHQGRLSGTFSYSHSDNVVGAQDGSYFQGGLVLDAALNLRGGRSSWENGLKVQFTQSKTPALDAFVKSLDNLDFQTTYYLRLKQPSWIGPYARGRLNTQLFDSYQINAVDTDIRKLYLDGSQSTFLLPAQEKLKLTSPFEPLVLGQNAGVFASPPGSDRLTLKAKLGFGLQEIVVGDSAFAVTDNGATPELEVQQLEQAMQGGAVMDLNLAGKPSGDVAWKVDTSFFFEAFTDSKIPANAFNMDLNAVLTVAFADWASLDYLLLIKHVPRIVDAWQVQNGLVLNVGFNLF
jgi:hypothetical protein